MGQTVYAVMHGEKSEGGGLESIHRSIDNAIKAALAVRCCFAGGWEADSETPNYWTNGCDFVEVVEILLED